jgi:polyhydroxyalkanoate synthesis regulator protein
MTNSKPKLLEETIKATYSPEAFTAQFNKGVEQAIEGSKISMKVITQQNALFLNAITKALSGSLLPNPFGFALGGQALEDCVAMQKEMMAAAMQQGAAVIEAIQEAGKTADKATTELTNMVQQSLTTTQKEIVDLGVKGSSSNKVQAIR